MTSIDAPPQPVHSASRSLLIAGLIAGPFYIAVGLLQILIREGFDPTRHALSLLSLGALGWIQIANFIITGLLVAAFAAGLRSALAIGRGRMWIPILIAIYGLALIASGIFIADPMEGFPPGTPDGPPVEASLTGILHFMSGGIGFLALIGATIIFARRFSAERQPRLALFSAATGALFLLGFIAVAASGGAPWGNIAFTFAVILSWGWLSAVAAHLLKDQRSAVA